MSYLHYQVEPGTIRGSVVSLVASSVGASTITIPYIMALNGVLGGIFWVIAGAAMTFYAGRLLIICGELNGKGGYEKLAKKAFGRRWKLIVGITQLISLIGFIVSYLTLVKTVILINIAENHSSLCCRRRFQSGKSPLLDAEESIWLHILYDYLLSKLKANDNFST